jgi:hypothetical protein
VKSKTIVTLCLLFGIIAGLYSPTIAAPPKINGHTQIQSATITGMEIAPTATMTIATLKTSSTITATGTITSKSTLSGAGLTIAGLSDMTATSATPTLSSTQLGAADAGVFLVDNVANAFSGIVGSTTGSGNGVAGYTSGGGTALYGWSEGLGNALRLKIDFATNSAPLVFGNIVSGSGDLIQLQTGGVDKFIIHNDGSITSGATAGVVFASATINGPLRVTGKLTADGVIDPTRIILHDNSANAVVEVTQDGAGYDFRGTADTSHLAKNGNLTLVGVPTPVITLPSITWTGGTHYEGTAAALSFATDGVNIHNYNFYFVGPSPTDQKYSFIGTSVAALDYIGTATALSHAEPYDIPVGITGAENLSAILFSMYTGVMVYSTAYCPESATATVSSDLVGLGANIDLVIDNVFVQHGAGVSFGDIQTTPITAAGASLWGGDGAGGDRTVITYTQGALAANSAAISGTITASQFSGGGAGLTGVIGTDSTKVLKAGDTMGGTLNMNSNDITNIATATASFFSGNGAALSNVNADKLDGYHYNGLPYLSTSGGTVLGDVVANNITATAGYFFEGDGSHLLNLPIPAAADLQSVLVTDGSATASMALTPTNSPAITVTDSGHSTASNTVTITTNNSNASANAFSITNTGAGMGVYITNTAASTGPGSRTDILNASNSQPAYTIYNMGTGNAIYAVNTGDAGVINAEITNTSATNHAIQGKTRGIGSAVVGHQEGDISISDCSVKGQCNAIYALKTDRTSGSTYGSAVAAYNAKITTFGAITNPAPLYYGENHDATGPLMQLSSGASTQTTRFTIGNNGDTTVGGSLAVGTSISASSLISASATSSVTGMTITQGGSGEVLFIQQTNVGAGGTSALDTQITNAANPMNVFYGSTNGTGYLIWLDGPTSAFKVGNDAVVDAPGYKVGSSVGADACVKYLEDSTTTRYSKYVKGLYIGKFTDSGCTTP